MLACCALVAASACTRTSDGSIELNRLELAQPRIPNVFKLRLPGWRAAQPAPVQSAASQFPRKPPAPQQIARTKSAPAKPRPRRVTAAAPPQQAASKPAASAEPSTPLVCRNDTQAAGRIRIVCE
jgi:type IV secretory pathway VirB10-like protein